MCTLKSNTNGGVGEIPSSGKIAQEFICFTVIGEIRNAGHGAFEIFVPLFILQYSTMFWTNNLFRDRVMFGALLNYWDAGVADD